MIHYSKLIQSQSVKYKEKTVYRYKEDGDKEWTAVSWTKFNELVSKAAYSLAKIGITVQENVAIFSQNKPEYLITEFALFQNRAVSVPIYATSSTSQLEYIINDASIRYLFVGEQYQYDVAWKTASICSSLKQIIIFDKNVVKHSLDKSSIYYDEFLNIPITIENITIVNERIETAKDDELAALLYTSGTTGESKGVMLMHSNFQEAMRIHPDRLPDMSDKDVSLNFLPMTHVFEKTWCFFCLYMGTEIVINKNPKEIQEVIKEIRPTIMCSVPRFWEKVYEAVQEKIQSSNAVSKKLFMDAIEVGRKHNIEYLNEGKKPPLILSMKYKFYDKTIFSLLKKTIGIENGNFFPTAGAALSDNINIFLHSVGIDILYGYGLTESTATVCCYWKQGYKIGTVGKVMPGVQVKIGPDNEIMLKGKTITKGYYNKSEENSKSFEDGWFKTGDAGKLEGDHLIMTERIKDLFKTSNGKYIAPQAIESLIGEDKYIDQIAVIGNKRKYVTALIVPTFNLLEKYAKQNDIAYNDIKELIKNPKINELFRQRIKPLQEKLANYEQIKRFTLLPKAFTMEEEELTNTLKIRRKVIEEKYEKEINNMYL